MTAPAGRSTPPPFWRSYREMARWAGANAPLAVLTVGLTGLLEGTALLALVAAFGDTGEAKGHSPLAFAVFTVLGITAAVSRLAADTLLLKVSTTVEETARRKMSRALLRTEWPHFIALSIGDISTSLIQEGGLMGAGTHAVLQAIGLMLAVAAYLAAALRLSPAMTLVTVIFGALGGLAYRAGTRAAQVHTDRLSSLMTHIGERIHDVFGSLKYFRASGRAGAAEREAEAIYHDFARTYFNGQIVNHVMRCGFDAAAVVFITLFLYVSLAVRGEPVSSTLVFLAIFYRLAPRLLSINDYLYRGRTSLSWYGSWKARLDFAAAHSVAPSGTRPARFDAALEFRDVTFRYPGSDTCVLRGVSFALRQRQCLGIIGPSGSGKSTLLDHVTGLLRPDRGTIRIDGVDLADLDADGWRRQIGVVLQDSPLFHTSVLANIAWGDEPPDRDKAMRCARLAHAWEFIERMPGRLDALVGEKGARLSGGQKQRLALARALYGEPRLLVLDEATSALDSEGEAVVQAALADIKGVCAIVIVAHRLATVRMADEIIVLEQGRIVEQGSWDAVAGGRDGARVMMAASR